MSRQIFLYVQTNRVAIEVIEYFTRQSFDKLDILNLSKNLLILFFINFLKQTK